MPSFSRKSFNLLMECDIDLQTIFIEAIATTIVDFGISEAYRSTDRQQQLFKEGKSYIDGIIKKGKHNYNPSQALDIYVYVPNNPNLSYDDQHMCYLAGHIQSTANRLYKEGKTSRKLLWGGNWNNDGCIVKGQKLVDMPHYELID